MNILITNDDGITAPGIKVLKEYMMNAGHQVLVCAPDVERSAIGHAITLRMPVWAKSYSLNGQFFGYASSGTPADCVKLGILQLARFKIDIVVSGINHGANLGTDVPYSGTVSGALEGAIMGYPSIAISDVSHQEPAYETAAAFLTNFLMSFDPKAIPPFGALNINVPSVPLSELKGFKITKQSNRRYDDFYEKRKDPYGNDYFWLVGNVIEEQPSFESDYYAVMNHYVSITPLSVFMNDEKTFNQLRQQFPG
ncbi:MAG TPA: 5'/3'-nucleotidase SurE [Thermotogota bacterium]|nr:5'/3'-nucleotidase SurE [Thermotogota bacterium]